MDDAQLLFINAEYICLQVGEEFKTFTSLADFKKLICLTETSIHV